jgi:hypothetical protein
VAEGVHHPADAWNNSEFSLEELVTHIHLHNNVLIVGASLIIGDPTTLSNLKLAILDKLLDIFFVFWAQS